MSDIEVSKEEMFKELKAGNSAEVTAQASYDGTAALIPGMKFDLAKQAMHVVIGLFPLLDLEYSITFWDGDKLYKPTKDFPFMHNHYHCKVTFKLKEK